MKLTEHEMLVTLATMALKMDDLTGHDVVEALRAHGYDAVVAEARTPSPPGVRCRVVQNGNVWHCKSFGCGAGGYVGGGGNIGRGRGNFHDGHRPHLFVPDHELPDADAAHVQNESCLFDRVKT